MFKKLIYTLVDKFKNPILDMPFNERRLADNQLTFSNYNRLKYLLYFMSFFSLILLSTDFIFFDEWNKKNLIILFFIADISLVLASITGLFIIHQNKIPSVIFQNRLIVTYLLIGAIWTGFVSGQDYEQSAITLIAGVFILTGGFVMKGNIHFVLLLALYTIYATIQLSYETIHHDIVTDFAIIPGTMIIAWIYGNILYKNKIESIQQSMKLQSYSNELQDMIEKRTSELKAKNTSLIKEINNKEFLQNQLIASEELFKSILFQSPDSVTLFKIGGEIIQWNSKAEEYTGLKSELIIGSNIWDLFQKISSDNENNEVIKATVKQYVQDIVNKPSSTSELKVKHWVSGNDSKRYLESKLFPIHLHDKTLISALSRDITQQLEDEKRIKEAMDNANQANAAKSDFLANISHDLRSPLNSISGFSQLLKIKPNMSREKQLKYLNIISDNGQYLLQLINSLIDLSKLQSGSIKLDEDEFNIEEFMHEVSSIIESEKTLYSPNIKLERNCKFETKHIKSDRTKLLQIFTNLLSNAIKFTKEGSVTYSCKIENGRLLGSVSDSGIGMSQEETNQIFNRFYSIKNDYNLHRKGKGLGLAIVKGYIELFNGEINVESKKGKGSTFTFSIPIKETKEKVNLSDQIKPPPNKKILVYDTQQESLEFTRELLNIYNLNVEAEQNLNALSSKIEQYKPDLLIIDI